jgi:hypothetical protein
MLTHSQRYQDRDFWNGDNFKVLRYFIYAAAVADLTVCAGSTVRPPAYRGLDPNKSKHWVADRYYDAFNTTRQDRWVFGDRDSAAYLAKSPGRKSSGAVWSRPRHHPMTRCPVLGRTAAAQPAR